MGMPLVITGKLVNAFCVLKGRYPILEGGKAMWQGAGRSDVAPPVMMSYSLTLYR